MTDRGRVGGIARALGFAGLLPQVAAVIALVMLRHDPGLGMVLAPVVLVAIAYPLVILSFLGGMWWTIAMRRGAGQGTLAAIAVVPSLVALVIVLLAAVAAAPGWPLVVAGSAILLTLFVDRHLAARGETPEGWTSLRVPLSLGLGGLTIATGVLLAA